MVNVDVTWPLRLWNRPTRGICGFLRQPYCWTVLIGRENLQTFNSFHISLLLIPPISPASYCGAAPSRPQLATSSIARERVERYCQCCNMLCKRHLPLITGVVLCKHSNAQEMLIGLASTYVLPLLPGVTPKASKRGHLHSAFQHLQYLPCRASCSYATGWNRRGPKLRHKAAGEPSGSSKKSLIHGKVSLPEAWSKMLLKTACGNRSNSKVR